MKAEDKQPCGVAATKLPTFTIECSSTFLFKVVGAESQVRMKGPKESNEEKICTFGSAFYQCISNFGLLTSFVQKYEISQHNFSIRCLANTGEQVKLTILNFFFTLQKYS
jgi:hypothetical protein